MNELDLIKLNIFEAYDNGEITYGEKEYLLEKVNPGIVASAAVGAGITTATHAGIGALIGAGVSVNKIRKIYDQQHANEMVTAEVSGNMSKYIAKREAAIKAAVKEAAKTGAETGAKVGAGIGLAKSAANIYTVKKVHDMLENTDSESTFDYLLESINDLYYED